MSEQQAEYLPAERQQSPNNLIALALERGADPEVLKKLMDLQERYEANQAKKAYTVAMTHFKIDAPAVLKKNDRVDFTSSRGRTAYNYANLGSIIQEISALLGKHELSASWSTAQENNRVTVSCHITHVAGHRESVTLTGPIDESGNKNAIQAVGSTTTYLQRYTLLAALGLATIEDDDDGRQGAGTRNEPPPASKASKKEPPPAQKPAVRVSLEEAIEELKGLTGGIDTDADIIKTHSIFVDKEGKEHFADSLDALMRSEKWAGSTLGRIRVTIQECKDQQREPGDE